MARSPAPRARRPLNVTEEAPVIPPHIVHATSYLDANKAKNLAAKDERDSFANCWKAMSEAKLSRFEITHGNKTYDGIISSETETEMSVDKLYALVLSGEITMVQFLKTVGVTAAAVKKELGANILMKCSTDKPGEAKLRIKERKG